MGAGPVKLPEWPLLRRVKRWQLILGLAVLLGVGAALFHLSPGPEPETPAPRQERAPPVGAYSIHSDKSGRTDFAMQTEAGRFGLRVGSSALDDMPYDLPFYPGAKLQDSASMTGADPGQSGRIVRFESADAPNKVVTYYRRQAREALLRILTDEAIGDAQVLAGIHPNRADGGFQLLVRARRGGGSEATLTSGFGVDVTEKPPVDPELELIEQGANATVPE